MHVFLDTNIFEKDSFWKNTFSKVLLDQAKSKRLSLYMSTVVYEELKRHTIRNHKKEYKNYVTSVFELNRFLPENASPILPTDVESYFKNFYTDLQDNHNLKILPFKDSFLPTVMDRAIQRKKPFNDEKTEVKDCIIWLTYANYVESNDLNPCYFINANTTDFYTKTPVTKDPTEYAIHEALSSDSARFRCFSSIKDFFQIVLEPQIQANERFRTWLTATVDTNYIFDLVKSAESRTVEGELDRSVGNWSLTRLFPDYEWSPAGYCQLNEVEWIECTEFNLDLLEDSCVVSAVVALHISVEAQAYNPVHDDNEDKYSYIGEKDIDVLVNVTFILHENNAYNSFNIDYIEYSRD